MFESVPSGGDVYLLKSVLHDWPDEDCESILRVCRAAMSPSSALLIVERLLAGPNEGSDTKFSDLNMFVMTGGRERSEDQFVRLLERSGLQHVERSTRPARGPSWRRWSSSPPTSRARTP